MQIKALEMACATDIGLQRSSNQDCVAIRPALNLVILADGMGGYKAGEVASCKAVEVVCDQLQKRVAMLSAVEQANKAVFELSLDNKAYEGMGTTLVAVHFSETSVTIANVGDSRLYRFRENKIEQLTVDQTLAQQLRDQDIEYHLGKRASAFEHILTNALGVDIDLKVSIKETQLDAGDVYLLCSDGLSGVLSDAEITQILRVHRGALEDMLQALLKAALQTAAPDNISVAAVRYQPE